MAANGAATQEIPVTPRPSQVSNGYDRGGAIAGRLCEMAL